MLLYFRFLYNRKPYKASKVAKQLELKINYRDFIFKVKLC